MELLTPNLGLIVWTTLAFLITLWILGKFAWKPIVSSLEKREQNIAESIQAAEKVKQEMAALKSENEELLAKARDERAQMLREAKETRDKIIADAKEQARQETNKIVSDAQAVINQQKMAAITELKNNVGKLVIEVSEKVLRRELASKEAQEQYIHELTSEVKLN
ncbi:MAG TPA: F0F1 ATP synthase subunit B [Ginsengibacter sp.]|nr:F0F1 ATP synthase subunit B [Chitinophagaceae bacterium]MCZ2395845.1 F0F1 ATP synthase subunit B [Chitinophagales bacterium]HRN72658.1 F0F1 ATP synthase subunit B [Ginsengibacter sp.]MCO5285374.1 F0F1 ATP synthase subunit B [Chitinophagaceae bacterium]MCW5913401.1 F0F1 ATP synthase subunit B [Chitinophagaceae bacterium]